MPITAGPRCAGGGPGDFGLTYSATPTGFTSATPTMVQCSDARCHLANCPELPASEPGFNSSCQQCLAERAELEAGQMQAETSFSPEAGDRRGRYSEGGMMNSSLSASVLSTKNLVSEEGEMETRGRGAGQDPGPGRTYECEDVCRQSAMSLLTTLGLTVIILGYLGLGAVTFSTIETRALVEPGHEETGDSPQAMNSNDLLATLSAEVNTYIDTLRGHTVSKLWEMTEQMNILYPINWTHNAAEELLSFQRMLSRKLAAEIMSRPVYPNAKPSALGAFQLSALGGRGEEWGISRGFLYSLSLLTTIGM